MRLLSIERVEREPYEDVVRGADTEGRTFEHRFPAPIEAVYDVAVEVGGTRHTFDIEVRRRPGPLPWWDTRADLSLEVDDEDPDRPFGVELPDSAWNAVYGAVWDVHHGNAPDLPLDLGPPPQP